jgi:two-component system, cell cycle sensor histidine kinase and response regulator CckA
MKTPPPPARQKPGAELPTSPTELQREIDERQRAEAALQSSETRYRRIVETAEEGIWMLDAEALTSFVNPKMAHMLGYSVEEMQGRALHDFMDETGRASAERYIGRRQQGIAEQHEFRFLRKDGSELWALLATNPIQDPGGPYAGALAMVTDITERRREVAELRATEARFRSLFEHSPNCLWEEDLSEVKQRFDELRASGVVDMRAHLEHHPEEIAFCLSKVKVLDVNQAALRHYQAANKAELIEGLDRILTAESFKVLTEELIALAEGQTVFESEAIDQTFTGKRNHILLKALVAPGAEATLSKIYVSIVDITEHLQLEEQLRQSQKMDAIGHLAGGVAHDFNNLLTVIHGNAALLQAPGVSAQQQAEAIDHITLATERAAGLTRQLLALSRRQVLQPRQLDVNEVVVNLTKLLERVLNADVALKLHLHPHPLLVRADAGLLDQVLMNLVVNARDAMPGGGQIVIETSETHVGEGGDVGGRDARPGRAVCLRVSDTGSGIAPAALSHIFEPFFTTKESGKGTGLGLSTAFGIVKQHGGSLSVTSDIGRGTTFTIQLPPSDSTVAPVREVPGVLVPRGGTESILLVEDEPQVRGLARRLLEMQGYRVQVVESGAAALELWDQTENAFDLVVTDLVMPGGISGKELVERLRLERPALKAIYISGYSGEVAGHDMALSEGVNFVQKPFGATALLECVRTCLDKP